MVAAAHQPPAGRHRRCRRRRSPPPPPMSSLALFLAVAVIRGAPKPPPLCTALAGVEGEAGCTRTPGDGEGCSIAVGRRRTSPFGRGRQPPWPGRCGGQRWAARQDSGTPGVDGEGVFRHRWQALSPVHLLAESEAGAFRGQRLSLSLGIHTQGRGFWGPTFREEIEANSTKDHYL